VPARMLPEQHAMSSRGPVQQKQVGHIETISDHREKRPDEQVDIEAAKLLPVYQLIEL